MCNCEPLILNYLKLDQQHGDDSLDHNGCCIIDPGVDNR